MASAICHSVSHNCLDRVMINSSFYILCINKYIECICLCDAPCHHTRHSETESPNVGGARILAISKSEDGFMWVKNREYKLHAKYAYYAIVLSTDPAKRSDVDVLNDLRAELVLDKGRVFEFSRVEPNNTQKPTFTVEAATDSNASGQKKGYLKWRLKFHNLRTYWNQEWKNMKSAWLKIVVDRNCRLNINMTYDKEKRVKSKKKLYEQKSNFMQSIMQSMMDPLNNLSPKISFENDR